MENEGKEGRREEEQIPLSVTFLKRNLCGEAEREREEEREMRPSEMGTAEIKEHYASLLLECIEQE